ncbi:RNA polymerase II subunit A C-terminal domain phosphatase isoform X1 [Oopsacas minuta]|uniref:RNA polymerase II subunit A C-terminal domain phosphatase n=1 Tax=Oopsacas minuta TaxID=111878 RepID=A0AAV7K864_9METZ|nr:RNA polymerase II subunit A C-terminal domain phosphatase isoform X1 [Oopsacas minuta]
MTSSPTADPLQVIKFSKSGPHELVTWRVREGDQLKIGTVLFEYKPADKTKTSKFHSSNVGVMHKVVIPEGGQLTSSSVICEIEKNCDHPEVVCGMCSHCGEAASADTGIPIVLGVPQIRVSKQLAGDLANEDKLRLLRQKKLALIVDLDQTLVHTSTDMNIKAGLPDVYGFRLKNYPHCYHARLRPHVHELLNKLSSLYELYIFTMGTHCYAHTLSKILDPQRKLFSQRIISRDECFDSRSKLPTIRSVFPCGDEMVAIIDDREDMWARCPNLVHVKPYIFFGSTGDIHAPERMSHHVQEAHAPSLPTHLTPPVIISPPVHSTHDPVDSKTDQDPPTESDSDPVTPAPEPDEYIVPVPVVQQEADDSVTDDKTAPINEYEQLIPPLSSSSDSSDSSEATNSSDSSSSPPAESKNETELTPDTQISPPPPPAPPKETDETQKEKADTEINDTDKFLLYLITTLTKIHSMFYAKYSKIQAHHGYSPTREQQLDTPDLKEIIPRLRHSVLKGACLLFTGVIPTNRNPQEDPIWNTARAFGATIHSHIYTPQESTGKLSPTTHVIATKPGTNKYREAVRIPGIHIVTPDWLWACAETWQWIDEKDYPVKVRRPSKDKLEIEDSENAPFTSQMDTIDPPVTPLDINLTNLPEGSERVSTPDRISFSLEDINAMNEEVNLAIYDCTSSSSDNELQDYPEGTAHSRKRKRPVASEPTSDNTTETGSSTDHEETGGKFDDMAAMLEREFEADLV